jgi:anionic cell wall polymer biosynthesis LytR-Cps2A-Psr (LCP) family protein
MDMRSIDDVRKVPKQVPQKEAIPSLHRTSDIAAFEKRNIEEAAERIRNSYYIEQKQIVQQPTPIIAKPKRNFLRKSYAMVAFTILVLSFGAYFGARFVSFANSISTSKQGFYETLSNNVGATLGSAIPVLKKLDNSGISQAIEDKRRINVLMLGYGGEGHSGSYLTDTIMLMSIDTATNKVTYIPVPRDLWVKIATKGYDGANAKINSAYSTGIDDQRYPDKLPQFKGSTGAGNLSKYEVSQVLGVQVDYFVAVDFYAFKKVVDVLGGVEIDVENSFTDYTYPSGDSNVDAGICTADDLPDTMITGCRYKKLHFDKGLQYMDGSRALEYARSRHAAGVEGSDYARSKRQQKLISAIEEKAISVGALTKIFSLMDSVQGHFKTDLSIADIKDLGDYVSGIDMASAEHISLTDSGLNLLSSSYSDDGQWILLPTKGDWSQIHSYIKDKLK